MISNSFSPTTLETQGVSLRAKMEWLLIENNKSQRWHHMWVEFVVGSLPCFERFFSRYSGFPLSSKTNIFKFQLDQESGRQRTSLWMFYLQIITYYLYLFIYPLYFFLPSQHVSHFCVNPTHWQQVLCLLSFLLFWFGPQGIIFCWFFFDGLFDRLVLILVWGERFLSTTKNYLRDGFKCTSKPREVVSHIVHSCRWSCAVELWMC